MSDDICASESQAVALATKKKRSSRQFTRQLTFVDIERSFTTAGEIETPDVLRNGGFHHQNGYWNGNGNSRYSDSNDRPVAIVIGSGNTSSKIATRELSQHLHRKGYRVALIDSEISAGQHLVHQINDFHNAQFFPCDASSPAAQFSHVWKTWNRIDLVCMTEADSPTGTAIVCEGLRDVLQQAVHFMRQNDPPGGKIIVSGSILPHQQRLREDCGTQQATAALVQFVREVAPLLKSKERILMNVVLSECVSSPTGMPKEMNGAVSLADCMTPMSTILAAYDVFIHDETAQVGKALEASADRLVFYDPPEYGKGHTTEQAASVCEVAIPYTCIAKDLGWGDLIPGSTVGSIPSHGSPGPDI